VVLEISSRTDRHTDAHTWTYSSQYFATAPTGKVVKKTRKHDIVQNILQSLLVETDLAMFHPVVHCCSMFSYLLLHGVQAFLDIVPADINVCCIQPVVVDRDCIFLYNIASRTAITVATLHSTMGDFALS